MQPRNWLRSLVILWMVLGSAAFSQELPKGVAWLWEYEEAVSLPPVAHNGVVLVVHGKTAQGLRQADGEQLWKVDLGSSYGSEHPPIQLGGLAILPASGSAGQVQAIEIASGKVHWSLPATVSAPRLCAGRLIVISNESLQALEPGTGEVRWRLPASKVSEVSVHGSRLFYASEVELGVWDLKSGKSLWRERSKELQMLELAPTLALSLGNDLVARDPVTGKRKWVLKNTDSYALLGQRVITYSDGSVKAVDAKSGQKLWDSAIYSRTFALAGGNLLAANTSSGVTLLDIRNGKELREISGGFFPPLAVGQGFSLAGGNDGHVYRLDNRSGALTPGIRDVWAYDYDDFDAGPSGLVIGELKLLPAGKALAALGPGPGKLHTAGDAEVELSLDSPQTPGKVHLNVASRYARKVTLSAYPWPAGQPMEAKLTGLELGSPAATAVWAQSSGDEQKQEVASLLLKEPGSYVVEARSGEVSERRLLVVTPLGVTVKLAPGQLLVQTLDLLRRLPSAGVTVGLFKPDDKLSPQASGVTDANGLLQLDTTLALDQPLLVNLRKGRENFSFELAPQAFSRGDKIFLQTDRPLYRPGHEIFFKGLAASGEGSQRKLIKEARVRVEIRDSGDNPLYSQELTSDHWGAFSGSVRLPAEPPLGRYRVSAQFGDEEPLFHLPFEVQEYRKPAFEVSLTPRVPLVEAGQTLEFDLKAAYYFGGPVAGGQAKVTVRRASLSGRPSPGNPGYQAYADFISEETVALNARGEAVLRVPTEPGQPNSEYLIDAEVTGPSGQVVEGSASGLAQAFDYGAYLSHDGPVLTPGVPASVAVETLDLLGAAKAGTVLAIVELYKGGDWIRVSKQFLKTGSSGRTAVTFTPSKNAWRYRVRASVANQPGEEEVSFWVYGANAGDQRELTSDRAVYQPGQTARLLLQARQAGPALLTVEGARIHETRSFTAKKGSQTLSLAIPPSFAPGVTATVTLEENGQMVSESVQLTVPDSEHKLTLQIRPDKPEYRPGESALLELTASDAQGQPVDADASLAVVDESLFALSPDQVPALHPFFFDASVNRVQTFHFEPLRSEVAGFQTVPAPTRVRKEFKDTAFWQPSVLIEGGKALVSVPLPDNLTRWRATTRAATATLQVGQASATLLSNLPLMVQAILPRFVVEGDSLDLLALVSNRTKAAENVQVSLTASPGKLQSDSASLENIAPEGQGRAVSRLAVEENAWNKAPLPDRLSVEVTARSQGESDAEQVSIPILPFGAPYAVGKAGLIKAGAEKEETIVTPRGLTKPSFSLRLAGSPVAAVEGALEYLADFPYGCVEQTMSRFMPTLVASQAMGSLGLSAERRATLGPMVETGLSRLYGYQHGDGGWGWWEYDATHPYMTGYVISGLAMAKGAGYTVSEPVLERGRRSALQQLEALDPKNIKPAGKDEVDADEHGVAHLDTRVYLAWALSVAGEPPLAQLEQLSATPLPKLSTYSVALLALAWQASPQPAQAAALVDELERRSRNSGVGIFWPAQALVPYGWTDDDVEATSLALRAVLKANPDSEIASSAVSWLLAQRSGAEWKSTRDTAQAVLALLDFAGAQQGGGLDRTGSMEILWDGKPLQTVPLSHVEQTVNVPAELLGAGEHRLQLRGSGLPALYNYRFGGFLRENQQLDLPADNHGIRMSRTYVVDQPGQILRVNRVTPPEILSVSSGKEVEVEVAFELPNAMQYLKLEDPRPAGAEVIEGSVKCTGPISRFEVRDAFMAVFFTRLPAGKYVLSYRVRMETPGDFRSLPARLELMYAPSVYGTSPSQRVHVARLGEK